MILDTLIEVEEYRAVVYKVLSNCYYLPVQETLDHLRDLEAALSQICPEAVTDVASMRQEADLDRLKIDFSQLFVGPFKLLAAPYGSVYLEGQRAVMGALTIDAEKRYREAGLDIAGGLNDAPDHIAVELEFLYFLIYKEIEALGNGDADGAAEWLKRQQSFLNRHVGIWGEDFSIAVEHGAKTAFYRHLARATRLFIVGDREALADMETRRQVVCCA